MTRLFGWLALMLSPVAALAYTVRHLDAEGAAGGVYWLLGFVAVLITVFVVAIVNEAQQR